MKVIFGGWAFTIVLGLGILFALDTFGWWAIIVPAAVIFVCAQDAKAKAHKKNEARQD